MAFSDVQTGLDAVRLARIAQNLAALEADLDFVVKLTAEQRSKMYSIGNSRFSFVEKALRFAKQFPNLLPVFWQRCDFQAGRLQMVRSCRQVSCGSWRGKSASIIARSIDISSVRRHAENTSLCFSRG